MIARHYDYSSFCYNNFSFFTITLPSFTILFITFINNRLVVAIIIYEHKISPPWPWSSYSRYYDSYQGAVAGLFIKNSLEERQLKGLSLPQLIRILKLIRSRKYIVYKQTATFALNIAQQTRNNINAQVI